MSNQKKPFTYFTLKTVLIQNYRRQSPGKRYYPPFRNIITMHYFVKANGNPRR